MTRTPAWGVVIAMGIALPAVAALAWERSARRAVDRPFGAFAVEMETILPGSPEEIYDAITGDLGGWWDHTFSESPRRLVLEPRPGGMFLEIFDESGNGALHATVIYAERGRLLRFEGPLGLSGHAIRVATTYRFEPSGADSTRLRVEVHGAGEMESEWPSVIEGVWRHFIFERFKPYVEAGRHRGGAR